MACLCSVLERSSTNAHAHTCTQYTEYLSAWERHAVFKQIIKGKVMRSCGGHSWGYSSECVHYCRRGRFSGGRVLKCILMHATGSLEPRGLKHIFKLHIKNYSFAVLRMIWSVHMADLICTRLSAITCACEHQHIFDTLLPTGLQQQFLLTFCETDTCTQTLVYVQMQLTGRLAS